MAELATLEQVDALLRQREYAEVITQFALAC
jgi:hypothetical protein